MAARCAASPAKRKMFILTDQKFYKKNQNIALIITDIKMPKMSGHVMAGQIMIIEEYTKRTHTPIIALTRYGDEQTKEKNRTVNISFELDKPFSEAAFIDILKKINFQ